MKRRFSCSGLEPDLAGKALFENTCCGWNRPHRQNPVGMDGDSARCRLVAFAYRDIEGERVDVVEEIHILHEHLVRHMNA